MNDEWEQIIEATADSSAAPKKASSRLKSRIFSQLMKLEQAEGPLRTLAANKAAADPLCVFEHLVALLPSADLQSCNPCTVCHARVLGEHVEQAPIYWPGCSYVKFCGRLKRFYNAK